MLVTGESGARAAQRGFLPSIFGRFNRRGAAAWGLLIIAASMSVIALLTLSPKVSAQFEIIIEIVVMLVVLAYAAAGASLLVGTKTRRPSASDRLLGLGAIFACILLLASYDVKMLLQGAGVILLVWIMFRVFGSRDEPSGEC